jgi:hypothetical protein
MIIVKLTGGIGNQMFQYALGRWLSFDRKTELAFDVSWYKISQRHYSLGNFQIVGKPATAYEKAKALFNKHIKEKTLLFDQKILSAPKNSNLDGYWQNPKYFEGIEDVLKKDFTLKDFQGEKFDAMLQKISKTNSVSLHVRREDYLAEKHASVYAECKPEYYQKALEYLASKAGNINIFVFSDDTAWVKENLKIAASANFVSNGSFSDFQELMLMSACKHNITANSTFSWWGAWLNQNPDKMVIAPKKWLLVESAYETGLLPPQWIIL